MVLLSSSSACLLKAITSKGRGWAANGRLSVQIYMREDGWVLLIGVTGSASAWNSVDECRCCLYNESKLRPTRSLFLTTCFVEFYLTDFPLTPLQHTQPMFCCIQGHPTEPRTLQHHCRRRMYKTCIWGYQWASHMLQFKTMKRLQYISIQPWLHAWEVHPSMQLYNVWRANSPHCTHRPLPVSPPSIQHAFMSYTRWLIYYSLSTLLPGPSLFLTAQQTRWKVIPIVYSLPAWGR